MTNAEIEAVLEKATFPMCYPGGTEWNCTIFRIAMLHAADIADGNNLGEMWGLNAGQAADKIRAAAGEREG